jgi:hypothetical protein
MPLKLGGRKKSSNGRHAITGERDIMDMVAGCA